MRTSSRKKGFALIVAIGVLALLFILVFAGANTSQVTRTFSRARERDRELTDATRQAVLHLVKTRASDLAPADTPSVIEVVRAPESGAPAIAVKATAGIRADAATLGKVLVGRPGDALLRVEARKTNGAATVAATYLVNTQNGRKAPILLKEERL